jgi:uncharacterized protein
MPLYAATVPNIKDDLDYLSADDMTALNDRIGRLQTERVFDVGIVITDALDGKSSMVYADDYYDYNGFGVDSQNSGLLLLINMADREVWISTTGRAIDYFTDSRIEEMIGNITRHLKNGDYDKACNTFLDDVAYYANEGIPSGQYRVDQGSVYYGETTTYGQRALGLLVNPIVYSVALVISIAATFGVTLLNKGRNTTNYKTYELAGSFDLRRSEDTYLREHLTRTKIEKSSSSSSTHSGSSGTSHGGGGGRF